MCTSFPDGSGIGTDIVEVDESGTADGGDDEGCTGVAVVDCARDGDAHAGGAGDVTVCSDVTGDTLRMGDGMVSKGEV